MNRTIVALGDGNTRYFLGDEGKCGPMEQAWPAQMEAILAALGAKTAVRNEGVPGETAADAREKFAARSAGAKLCILGFGMEDIRRPERTMASYLAEMADMFRQAKEQGMGVIALGIPWFDKNYAGELVQTRLPKWNAGLSRLCEESGVPFVDLYQVLGDDPDRWYGERKLPRHNLSAAGERKVAELVLPLALLRPFSGSGSTALAASLFESCPPDSFAGRVISVLMGSSETTFYAVAVYFGAVGVKKSRWTIPAALTGDLTALAASAAAVLLWFPPAG